jgi:4-hydroxybenzoate polyprenyltransferase
VYSAPPWRWKDRPFLALAANAFAHGFLAFLAGKAAAGPLDFNSSVAALPYVCGVAAVYLFTTIPDLDGDRKSGKHTLAVLLGPERTARWAMGWYLAALLLATYMVDLLFLLAVLPAAIPIVQAGRGRPEKVHAAVTWPVLGLSVAAALWHPWYALVLGLGYWATRSYYARAWGRTYP